MIQTVPETGSTNADLAARIAAHERVTEGDWLVADRQSAGRGRQGRAWFDGAGNFMGSTVVWPGQG
ncbi:MAG: biotin--[acetyl-CoA-carboxylase] ligase, partial [Novosphingobium sp.]|nr:biotin--[acetyl-CoA-carboxylase] ligase [Novosphingobium sp.]